MRGNTTALAELRKDVQALLEDVIAGEADHNLAAGWAGEQFNAAILTRGDVAADPVLLQTLALIMDLGPRRVPSEIKPGSFERMVKRLLYGTLAATCRQGRPKSMASALVQSLKNRAMNTSAW